MAVRITSLIMWTVMSSWSDGWGLEAAGLIQEAFDQQGMLKLLSDITVTVTQYSFWIKIFKLSLSYSTYNHKTLIGNITMYPCCHFAWQTFVTLLEIGLSFGLKITLLNCYHYFSWAVIGSYLKNLIIWPDDWTREFLEQEKWSSFESHLHFYGKIMVLLVPKLVEFNRFSTSTGYIHTNRCSYSYVVEKSLGSTSQEAQEYKWAGTT